MPVSARIVIQIVGCEEYKGGGLPLFTVLFFFFAAWGRCYVWLCGNGVMPVMGWLIKKFHKAMNFVKLTINFYIVTMLPLA